MAVIGCWNLYLLIHILICSFASTYAYIEFNSISLSMHDSIVSTSKGNKILTKEEFNTYKCDGKIDTVYGTRMKQGGGEMKDYNDITYVLKD
jgi:hypothetical protein